MKTRIELFDENRRLTAQHEALRQTLAVREKELVQALETLKIERDKLGYELRERSDKASFAVRTLDDAKQRAENEACQSRGTAGVAVYLLMGIDRAIARLK